MNCLLNTIPKLGDVGHCSVPRLPGVNELLKSRVWGERPSEVVKPGVLILLFLVLQRKIGIDSNEV
jgi:hypothetical protein